MLSDGSAAMIIFPHLGIKIGEFSNHFNIGSFEVAYYGLIIAVGMVLGVLIAMRNAKVTNQNPDDYIDYAIAAIISSIVGARLYYVLFSLDYYKEHPDQILNIRGGGLAIYGGIIFGFAAAFVVAKVKKQKILRVLDTVVPGIVLGQAIGRWGNFFNREAYGEFTDTLFAMQIKKSEASGVISDLINQNIIKIDGVDYIQVHPTFLYESIWCIALFVLLMIFQKRQKYNGEVLLWYLGGYALGRSWIEGLRTDQLLIGHTGIAVSQLLSILLVLFCLAILIINRIRIKKKTWVPEFRYVLADGDNGTISYAQRIKEEKKSARKK